MARMSSPRDRTQASATRALRTTTDGRGVDLFIDVVGGPQLPRAIAATRVGGTVLLLGYVGGTAVSLDLISVIRRAVTLRAVSGGSRTSFERLVQFMEQHRIRPFVDRAFGFADIWRAYEHFAHGRPAGKVVV